MSELFTKMKEARGDEFEDQHFDEPAEIDDGVHTEISDDELLESVKGTPVADASDSGAATEVSGADESATDDEIEDDELMGFESVDPATAANMDGSSLGIVSAEEVEDLDDEFLARYLSKGGSLMFPPGEKDKLSPEKKQLIEDNAPEISSISVRKAKKLMAQMQSDPATARQNNIASALASNRRCGKLNKEINGLVAELEKDGEAVESATDTAEKMAIRGRMAAKGMQLENSLGRYQKNVKNLDAIAAKADGQDQGIYEEIAESTQSGWESICDRLESLCDSSDFFLADKLNGLLEGIKNAFNKLMDKLGFRSEQSTSIAPGM